jgi:hypothetical protein
MENFQIICTLPDVTSFLDVFPYDLLPSSHSILKPCTLIVNADPNAQGGSHRLFILLTPCSSSAEYFDAYGIVPLVPSIQAFLKRNCTTWKYD